MNETLSRGKAVASLRQIHPFCFRHDGVGLLRFANGRWYMGKNVRVLVDWLRFLLGTRKNMT
ncbi:hypothetical protein ACFL2Q_02110 [Thermodesulfobacteriota bacterium]